MTWLCSSSSWHFSRSLRPETHRQDEYRLTFLRQHGFNVLSIGLNSQRYLNHHDHNDAGIALAKTEQLNVLAYTFREASKPIFRIGNRLTI
eukprot:6163420-Pyramimonas_sp.AAC.1